LASNTGTSEASGGGYRRGLNQANCYNLSTEMTL
jgi:hypothetical protein